MTYRGRFPFMAVGIILAVSSCLLHKELENDPEHRDERTPSGSGDAQTAAPGSPPGLSEAELKATEDIVGYAKYCKQELGLTQDVLKSWNCLDGAEIPTTVEGKPLDQTNYDQLKAHKIGCDLGSWLGDEPCANYGFVQQRQLTPDVKAVLLCRKRGFDSWKTKAERETDLAASLTDQTFDTLYAFDSLGLIWTNVKTGKTCFFDFVGKVYGGYVASPDDERSPDLSELPSPPPPDYTTGTPAADLVWHKNGRTTWRGPQDVVKADNCVRCHDSGALKGSAWIMQVFNVPVNDPAVPFQVVGSAFEAWKKALPLKAISTAPFIQADGTSKPQACTQCHRIGSQATCDSFLNFSVGKAQPGKMSNLANTYFYKTWMPPPPADWHGRSDADLNAQWTATYDKHVARLKCCCDNPTAKGCTTQDFTTSPLPAPIAGTGPAICP